MCQWWLTECRALTCFWGRRNLFYLFGPLYPRSAVQLVHRIIKHVSALSIILRENSDDCCEVKTQSFEKNVSWEVSLLYLFVWIFLQCCRESSNYNKMQPPLPPCLHLWMAGAQTDVPHLWEGDVLWGDWLLRILSSPDHCSVNWIGFMEVRRGSSSQKNFEDSRNLGWLNLLMYQHFKYCTRSLFWIRVGFALTSPESIVLPRLVV